MQILTIGARALKLLTRDCQISVLKYGKYIDIFAKKIWV